MNVNVNFVIDTRGGHRQSFGMSLVVLLAEPTRVARQRAPLLGKFGNLSTRENLVVMSAYVRLPIQPLGEGEGSPKTSRWGVENTIFSWRKSRGGFWQLVFFGWKSHDHRRF